MSHAIPTAQELLAYIQFNENPINNRGSRLHPYIKESIELLVNTDGVIRSSFFLDEKSFGSNSLLSSIFNRYGTDKSSRHSYDGYYSYILKNIDQPRIIEIGLGSENSYPYAGLTQGGSINSWREYRPNAYIIGGDIDKESVDACKEMAFEVDQTCEASIKEFKAKLKSHCGEFDLIIDDGFHDPHANLRTYLNLYDLLSPTGVYVIEDVHKSLLNFWVICCHFLPGQMKILDLSDQRPEVEDNIIIEFRVQS